MYVNSATELKDRTRSVQFPSQA